MGITNFILAKLILAKSIYNKISRTSSVIFFSTNNRCPSMLDDPIQNPIEINEIVFCATVNESSNLKHVKNLYPVFLHNQIIIKKKT